jgi:hypothetical protein
MRDRQRHRREVQAFLQKHFSSQTWEFTLPDGRGNETYFASNSLGTYFVKVGAHIPRYQAMGSLGLTPPALVAGFLEDGVSILVQAYVAGRKPARRDYQSRLEKFAGMISRMHRSPAVQGVLPQADSDSYRAAGARALERVQQTWARWRAQVPQVTGFVDDSLAYLAGQVQHISGAGLAATHNDLCNANWLLTPQGDLYLTDLEAMAMDDPVGDLGATLWWYYPPAQREAFLCAAGYADDEAFRLRMHVRMALHCLAITLPREGSFDRFDPGAFPQALVDFRAILANEENPQGYG